MESIFRRKKLDARVTFQGPREKGKVFGPTEPLLEKGRGGKGGEGYALWNWWDSKKKMGKTLELGKTFIKKNTERGKVTSLMRRTRDTNKPKKKKQKSQPNPPVDSEERSLTRLREVGIDLA